MSHDERVARYRAKFPARRKLSNKLNWLKTNYGEEAALHFLAFPFCKDCGERRLSALAVHHLGGKLKKKFRTLCHNCHAVRHHGSDTIDDCVGMTTMGIEIT